MKNRITDLFEIEYPIIQAGMVWVSGYKLAVAVSECGGLGLIGAGSMKPDLLREHIKKAKAQTSKPFGVNIPLLRGDAEDLINVVIEENVKIVFTSAGHPGKFIDKLKSNQIKVVHVVPSVKYAKKAEEVGCDAIVGEGYEAGGHNGFDEITTFCLIPMLVESVRIPVIAAGGIATGKQIAAALALGAEGVQIGTRFAATFESSAHENYKRKIVEAEDNGTVIGFRKIGLVRMIKNNFALRAIEAEKNCADEKELREIWGEKRERLGIFEGDTEEGALEAGQSAGLIKEILPVKRVFEKLLEDFDQTALNLLRMV
ncbi:MAG: nitronate monooxygenase [Ignavibacteria bacterium]|nr:nitronate monooxygenase [Ignavibacteria bacterium]MDH7527813.1 nitronate monooxygenase [Ignavibacteria bacterium]